MNKFLLLHPGKISIAPDARVLKASEYQAIVSSDSIIDDARDRAQEIEDRAREAFEEEKRRGYREGMLEAKKQMMQNMLDVMTKAKANLRHQETQIVATVIAALRKVIGDMDKESLIRCVVQKALSLVGSEPRVIVHVSPCQREVVEKEVGAIVSTYPLVATFAVVSNETLDELDCILETPIGKVVASLDEQLEIICSALKKGFCGTNKELLHQLEEMEQELVNYLRTVEKPITLGNPRESGEQEFSI